MYNSPVRRRAALGLADVHARQVPADRHTGDREDFLRRHELEAKQAAQSSRQDREAFAAQLLKRAGDTRNVRLAVDHCASRGQAAGPDGLRPSDLDNEARWSLTNELSQLIQNGSYRPSKSGTKWIDKGCNRGKRPIRIQNFSDRCVERAVLQVIRPMTEAQYLNRSFGFRSPGRSREEALATAERLAFDLNKWSWISEDLKDAFEQIPTARLLQVIRKMIPADPICDFIERIATTAGSKRGIRQGGPLSPELLNIYLHWMLDRWWYQRFPNVPMLRVADDILILTDPQNAEPLWNALNERTRAIGMPLKGTPASAIRNLNAPHNSVDWLGYRIQRGQTQLEVAVSEKSWSKLDEHLAKAWEEPSPPLAANNTIRGWISQQGAAYQEDGVEMMGAGIRRLALLYGFNEIPGVEELASLWHQAYLRDWIRERREVLDRVRSGVTLADGFADQHCNFSTVAGDANSSPIVPSGEVYLFTDGSCLATKRGVGGWAYLIIDSESGVDVRPLIHTRGHPITEWSFTPWSRGCRPFPKA